MRKLKSVRNLEPPDDCKPLAKIPSVPRVSKNTNVFVTLLFGKEKERKRNNILLLTVNYSIICNCLIS